MTLNGVTRAMLDSVAAVVVSGQGQTLPAGGDQDDLDIAFMHDLDIAVAYLTERVAHHSNGQSTIRRADATLSVTQIMSVNLYVVLCPGDTPEGVVAELDEGMVLINLGPYDRALETDSKRALRT